MIQYTILAGIPMRGPVDSLNASVAGSIGLYVLAEGLSRES